MPLVKNTMANMTDTGGGYKTPAAAETPTGAPRTSATAANSSSGPSAAKSAAAEAAAKAKQAAAEAAAKAQADGQKRTEQVKQQQVLRNNLINK